MQHRNIEKDNTIMYSGWRGGGECVFVVHSNVKDHEYRFKY